MTTVGIVISCYPRCMAKSTELPAVFIVVCVKLHSAMGPYPTPEIALDIAKRLNADPTHKCDYVPVPLVLDAEYAHTAPITDTPPTNRKGHHGYL